MNHHDGDVLAILRHHVPDVHLVHSDVAGRAEIAQLPLRLLDGFATDEEAALGLQDQRCVGRLQILESLRHHSGGRTQDRDGNTRANGSAKWPEGRCVHSNERTERHLLRHALEKVAAPRILFVV